MLRINKSSEFLSKRFNDYYNKNGKRKLSQPRTSQQNGIAKMHN